jgi:hypothetical protein
MTRELIRVTVEGDNEGARLVRIDIPDEHVSRCPSCLSMFALRLSAAFLERVQELRDEIDESEPEDDSGKDSKHGLH